MKALIYLLPLLAVLTACTSDTGYYDYEAPYTYNPYDPDYQTMTAMTTASLPAAYTTTVSSSAAAPSSSGLPWREWQGTASYTTASSNESVTVFPLEQSLAPAWTPESAYTHLSSPPSVYAHQMPQRFDSYMPVSSMAMPVHEMSVLFADGSAQLSASDRKAIQAFAEDVQDGVLYQIEVTGRASRDGRSTTESEVVNLDISAKRAVAVSSALIRAGVAPANIRTVAMGAANASGFEQEDRRVDLRIIGN